MELDGYVKEDGEIEREIDLSTKAISADKILKKAVKSADEVVDLVSKYSLAQKDVWQRIPYLALMAHMIDIKNRELDSVMAVYLDLGLDREREILSAKNKLIMHIDLATGDIVYNHLGSVIGFPDSEDLVRLAYHPHKLNASAHLSYFIELAHRRELTIEEEEKMKEQQEEWGIKRVYERKE
jgi:hypothetical protein